MNSSIPAARASSTTCWISGRSEIGSISLGITLVAGRKRVPSPATGNTALRTGRTGVLLMRVLLPDSGLLAKGILWILTIVLQEFVPCGVNLSGHPVGPGLVGVGLHHQAFMGGLDVIRRGLFGQA